MKQSVQKSSAQVNASRARNRSLLRATATSGLARGVAVLLNVIGVPIAVRSLGVDGYGLWMAITSISSFLIFADLGLSNGLVAVISEAHGKQDRNAAVRAVSTAFVVLSAAAIALSVLALLVGPHVPWAQLLNLTGSRLSPDLNTAIVTFIVLQIAIVPALVAQKVQIGYQEMHWTNGWQVLGSTLSFAGIIIASQKHWGLTGFIAVFTGGPLIAQFVGTYVLFVHLRPWLFPRIKLFDWNCGRALAGTGTVFVLLQLLAVVGTSSDQLVLTRYVGLAAVAEYSLAQRLFSGASVIQFFLLPLWPAFGEALSRGDHQWARLALKRAVITSLALSFVSACAIAIAAPWLSAAWVPQIRKASSMLLGGFIATSLITAYGGAMSVFLNNSQTVRSQLKFYAVASLGAFIAKLLFVRAIGVSGVLWGTVAGYGLLYVMPAWRLAQKTLQHLEDDETQKGHSAVLHMEPVDASL